MGSSRRTFEGKAYLAVVLDGREVADVPTQGGGEGGTGAPFWPIAPGPILLSSTDAGMFRVFERDTPVRPNSYAPGWVALVRSGASDVVYSPTRPFVVIDFDGGSFTLEAPTGSERGPSGLVMGERAVAVGGWPG